MEGLIKVQIAYLDQINQLINLGRVAEAKVHVETAREFFPEEERELKKLMEKIENTPREGHNSLLRPFN